MEEIPPVNIVSEPDPQNIPQTIPQPGPVESPVQPKKGLKKPFLIGIVVIAILLLAGAVLLIYMKYSGKNKRSPVPAKPTPEATMSSASVSGTTQKYEDNRITFEYPSGWILKTKPTTSIESTGDDFYGIGFGYLDFIDYKGIPSLSKSQSCTNVTVDGKRAWRCSEKVNPEPGIGETFYDSVNIEQVVGVYLIAGTATSEATLEKNKTVFDQVLNSIRFKTFSTRGCGGIDTQGELLCECSGQLLKNLPPIGGLGIESPNIGSHTCKGDCGQCCYTGSVIQNEFPSCK